MTKTIRIKKFKFTMDDWLLSNLEIAKYEAIPNDWDFLIPVIGGEGSGKSTHSSQIALFLDNNFDLNSTVFTAEQFIDAVDNAKNGQAILWDEAITGANIKMHYDEVNQAIVSKMTQIRDKNLYILMLIPYLNLLDKYFVSRCLGGIYVYAKDFNDRGHAYFYNQPQLEYLYFLQKVKYIFNPGKAYSEAPKSFYYAFDNVMCLPIKEYKQKKHEARSNQNSASVTKSKIIEEIFRTNSKAKVSVIMELLKVSDVMCYKVKKKLKI